MKLAPERPFTPPPKPGDERARQASLNRYRIVDTETESAFDALATLAAQVCRTPIAIVGLIDGERHWFKAAVGVGDLTESSRELSFCGHALLEPSLFVVPDARLDVRFCGNPLVTGEPHLRFYAGAVLRAEDGQPLGTLCVFDTAPRALPPEQLAALQTLADQAMAQIELRKQMRDVQELNVRLRRAVNESHHRIKNNLQVLASLVDVQRLKHPEQVPRSELDRLSAHIRALGVLHDLLATETEFRAERVTLRKPLERLLPLLATASGGRTITLAADPEIALPIARANALLPLVAELVGNGVKHGTGAVHVDLRFVEDSKIELTVSNEGGRFPDGFDPARSANTGLDLIESLVRWDLKGEVRYENAK